MTGFGYGSIEMENQQISCELKSLNSRFLDLHIRMPLTIKEKELEVRQYLGQLLLRGKIELNLSFEQREGEVLEVDHDAFYEKYRTFMIQPFFLMLIICHLSL